ncbi:MAG: type I restriction endonuclease subunit R [Egibacteraceae bacterium]
MSRLEYELVQRPLEGQLEGLGWTDVKGTDLAGRQSFREVLLEDRLREALRRINLDDHGREWLDGGRVAVAVSALSSLSPGLRLLEANREATALLLGGVVVPGVEGWDQGRSRTVHFIDWEHLGNNDFLAISQFRVDEPGGHAKPYIAPDVVLFVNGIPLVVVECKAPGPEDAMAEAIRQLRRYANQRPEIDTDEGNERLFWTNQFVVATTGEVARAGTITSGPEHFLEWKDTAPVAKEQVAAALGKPVERLTSQELLVAGMLRPAHLLDIVRHFTLFMETDGHGVKAVCRYQQFRAVRLAAERLKTGATRARDGEVDRRGGIVWHTQGSGKSLTMAFLVRVMRSNPALRRFKVVVVTDRTDLQDQLVPTAELSDESVLVAKTSRKLRELLSQPGPGLVMAMIQKYRDTATNEAEALTDDAEPLPELNTDESILVLVDEAHRSHGSKLHANLLAALPNAARIGFTGTPIVMGARKKTYEIFGSFIDRYTLSESEADGSTVPLLYEGRTAEGAVAGAAGMDELFFHWFAGLTEDQRDELQQHYATVADVLEAPELITAKSRDLLAHYVSTVMPQRLKGMVVATSRLACARYREALLAARDDLVTRIETLDPAIVRLTGDAIEDLGSDERLLMRVRPHLDLLRELEFVPVFSGAHNDDPTWAQWTDKQRQRSHTARFKKPLGPPGEDSDPLALLIVQSMLLTGFDVPIAQVLYLDRLIREAELLQAIARVNRTSRGKDHGLVVDYYGVARHLTEALAAYTSDDVDGSLRSLSDEIERLGSRHQRLRQFFAQGGIEPADDPETVEACVALLEDERLRAAFDVDLKRFLSSLDIVLPRPEARPFIPDAKRFAAVQVAVRRRYRDQDSGGFDPSLYREKVRQLVDEHITVLDLSQKIPPVAITDASFADTLAALPTDRAKASEMEHAARHHIRTSFGEDPARYQKLSERLEEILDRFGQNWEQLALALDELIEDAKAPPGDDGTGLDPVTEGPFYGLLAQELPEADVVHRDALVALTYDAVSHVRAEIRGVGFWSSAHKQDQLRAWIKVRLDHSNLYPALSTCDRLATELVDLAKANHHKLVGG